MQSFLNRRAKPYCSKASPTLKVKINRRDCLYFSQLIPRFKCLQAIYETISIYLSTSNLKVLLRIFSLFSLNGEPFSETLFADVRSPAQIMVARDEDLRA
jgi:hypothetical protein